MRTKLLFIAAAAGVLSLTGCNKAESPSEVQQDVARATQEAEKETTEALLEQSEQVAEANDTAADGAEEAAQRTAAANAEVAITRAQGEHKIAVQKCEAMAGKEQEACKDKADATLELAKADANVDKAAVQQR